MGAKGGTRSDVQRRLDIMVQMRQAGKTYVEISQAVGVTAQWAWIAVNSVLKKPDKEKPGMKSVYNEAQWNWVRDCYAEGYSSRQLARFLGVHESTVRAHTWGIVRSELPPLEDRKAEFMRLAGDMDVEG